MGLIFTSDVYFYINVDCLIDRFYYRESHFAVQFQHGLHTLAAMPRLTQPPTLHEMVKWMSALGLIHNTNGDQADWWLKLVGLVWWLAATWCCVFIGWTPEWTYTLAVPWWQHQKQCKHCSCCSLCCYTCYNGSWLSAFELKPAQLFVWLLFKSLYQFY